MRRSHRYFMVDGLSTGEWCLLRQERSRLDESVVDAI